MRIVKIHRTILIALALGAMALTLAGCTDEGTEEAERPFYIISDEVECDI